MWFHLHRALQFLGLVAHIVVVLLPTLEFGKYTQDSLLTSHKILAWSLTAFLGHQWISAVFFRPNKDHAKRGLWNMIHFAGGRIAPLAALATIVIGIELYVRKQAPEKIMTKSSWVRPSTSVFVSTETSVLSPRKSFISTIGNNNYNKMKIS